MNIAFLTPEYVTESNFDGGLSNYLFCVAREMKKRGHNVEIFTRSDRDEDFSHHGIYIHCVKVKIFFVLAKKMIFV